ncbi:type II toxin-antitoxin system antitoxin [Spirochaetota bacterium]
MATQSIVNTILKFYPNTEAIYLFGSYGTEFERPDSDLDIALLLPWSAELKQNTLALTPCWSALTELFSRKIDLINLRGTNTVFQNEIINTGRVIYEADEDLRLAFEMLVLSMYQKLSEERKEILESFFETKRAYKV